MTKKTLPMVAARLRRLMSQRPDLDTQDKVAKRTGRGKSLVGKWVRGESQPRAEDVAILCDAFDVSADFFVGRSEFEHGLAPDAYIVDVDALQRLRSDPRATGKVLAKVPRHARIIDHAEAMRLAKELRLEIGD